jgi:hypothetical protein
MKEYLVKSSPNASRLAPAFYPTTRSTHKDKPLRETKDATLANMFPDQKKN